MKPDINPDWDKTIAELLAVLKLRKLQAHTYTRGGSLIVKPRRAKQVTRGATKGQLR